MSGFFITFEGPEACGKSTQLQLIADRLRAAGHPLRTLREPGGTAVGEALRHNLKDCNLKPFCPRAELLMMNASRAQLVEEVIRPALQKGEIILCDRFADSTRAYQGAGRSLPSDDIEAAISIATGGTEPDLTLIYTISQEIADRRVRQRSLKGLALATDRFDTESAAFFRRVRDCYADLPRRFPNRAFAFIDAEQTVEITFDATWGHIQRLFNKQQRLAA